MRRRQAVSQLGSIHTHNIENTAAAATPRDLKCFACRYAVSILNQYLDTNPSEQCIGAIVIKLCELLKIEDTRVCKDAIGLYRVGAE